MAKPGVMFYFDTRPCLKRLSNEDKGRLFEAILNYSEFGELPEFEDMLGVAWDFIQPRIDRDNKRYEDTVAKRRQAAAIRWETEKEPSSEMHINANASKCISPVPNTPTNTSTSVSSDSSAATSSIPATPALERFKNDVFSSMKTDDTMFETRRQEIRSAIDSYPVKKEQINE